jgi:hypothetical protein
LTLTSVVAGGTNNVNASTNGKRRHRGGFGDATERR